MSAVPARRCASPRPDERAQATVELALLLPSVVLVLLLTVQVGLVVGDRVALVHAARAGARVAMVEPGDRAVEVAVRESAPGLDVVAVELTGGRRRGDLVTVGVTARPRAVPGLSRLVRLPGMRESFTARVE